MITITEKSINNIKSALKMRDDDNVSIFSLAYIENLESRLKDSDKNSVIDGISDSRPIDQIRSNLSPVSNLIRIIEDEVSLGHIDVDIKRIILQEIIKSKANIKSLCDYH